MKTRFEPLLIFKFFALFLGVHLVLVGFGMPALWGNPDGLRTAILIVVHVITAIATLAILCMEYGN